jgi:hypothetical protein
VGANSSAVGDSTAIGHSATTSAAGATALGQAASAGSNSIAIGRSATTTAANQLVIGSTTSAISQGYFGNGVTAAAPNNFTLQGTGSTALGVAGAAFAVSGGAGATATTGSAGGSLTLQGGNAGGTGANDGGDVFIAGGTATGAGVRGDVILQQAGGKVGIGTGAPQTKLEVVGDANTFIMRAPTATSYGSFRVYNDQNSAVRALEIGYGGSTYATALLSGGFAGETGYVTTTGAKALQFGTNNLYRMGIDSSGNVGIGTASLSSPNGRDRFLQISGSAPSLVLEGTNVSINASYEMLLAGTVDNLGSLNFTRGNSTTLLSLNGNGNVGIGTISPNLGAYTPTSSIVATIKGGATQGVLELASSAVDADGVSEGDLVFAHGNTTDTEKRLAIIRGSTDGTTANNRGGQIQFSVQADGGNSFNTAMTIRQSGNVGIGDTSPAYALTVGNGDLFGVQGADGSLIWEGSVSDANQTVLTVVNPTADVTYRLADAAAGTYDICTTANNCAGVTNSLQSSYNADADGSDAIIALTTADDSLIFRNPAASGTDSGYVNWIDQLNTGNVDALRVNNAGTGDLLELQDNGTAVLRVVDGGHLTANGAATATTGTTEAVARTNVTAVTLTTDAFSVDDVLFFNNAGQDYYTRVTVDNADGTYTVSPAVSYDASITVTKYTVQNIGATATDYATLSNRFFQGYFLGGVVTGAGSTTLSDGNLSSTGNLVLQGSGGNVGIGTASPKTNLNIYNGNESTTLANFTQSVTDAGLLIESDYTASAYTSGLFWTTSNNNPTKPKAGIYTQNTGSGTNLLFGTSNDYATGINNDHALFIQYDGRVGINNTSPTARFTVDVTGTSDAAALITGSATANNLYFNNISGTNRAVVGYNPTSTDAYLYNMHTTGNLALGTNNIERLTIDENGYVGIGDVTPSNPLQVAGVNNAYTFRLDAGATAGQSFGAFINAGTNSSDAALAVSNQTGASSYLYVRGDGNVGIGTTTPGYKLEVSGTGYYSGNLTVGASSTLNLTGGTTASRPGSPTEGMLYFDTDTDKLLVFSGGKWQADRSTATKIVAASNSSQQVKDSADYVADGTGDQTEINAALTAAAGGKVYLAEGTYTVNASITVPSNTTLSGAGTGSVITIPNSHNAAIDIITNSDTVGGNDHITLRDFRIDGNDANQTLGAMNGIAFTKVGSGLGATAVEGAKMTGLSIDNMRYSAIVLTTSNNNHISGVTIGSPGDNGVVLSGSSYNTVSSNRINEPANRGVSVTSTSTDNNIADNSIVESANYGILVESSSTRTNITGNSIYSPGNDAITVFSGANTITANTITNSAADGMEIDSSNNVITGNYIEGSLGNGIGINNTSNFGNIVNGNKLHNNGGSGAGHSIQVFNSDSNNITGNDITDTAGTGYAISIVDAGSNTNYLADNRFSGTGATSMNDLGTGTVYANQARAANGGQLTIRTGNDTQALQVQTATGTAVLTVDTTNSQTVLRSANNTASIGAELLSGNCSGTNWAGTGAGPYVHTAGSAVALGCTVTGGVTSGATYEVTFTTTGMAATDTITPAIGGVSGSKTTGDVASMSVVITTTGTTAPTFTLNNAASTGSVTGISYKLITNSNSALVVQYSGGTAALEVRTGAAGVLNTYVGLGSGKSTTSGDSNTALGTNALQSDTTGSSNTAVGALSLFSNTIGGSNVAVGSSALYKNTNGSSNIAIGREALYNNTVGNENVAVGKFALQSNATGSYNNAFGNSALKNTTTGSFNTATGHQALFTNSTGTSNTANGYSALYTNTGSNNTATGNASLYLNSTGTNNTANGSSSLYNNSTGSYNTAIGDSALYNNYTGSNNTAIGFNAGNYDPNISAFATLTNLTNATAIGYGSQVQGSNSLILGGQGVNAVSVGIGTTMPTNTLSVSPIQYSTGTAGTGGVSSTTVTGVGTTWTSAMVGSEIVFATGVKATITAVGSTTSLTVTPAVTVANGTAYRIHYSALQVTSGGNVGIGDATPDFKFEIQNTEGTAYLGITNVTDGDILSVTSTGVLKVATTAAETLSGAKLLVTSAEVTTALRVGTGTDGVSFNDGVANKLRLRGTARNDVTVSLKPEFEGAILRGDGSSNTGTMTSDLCSGTSRLSINTVCGATEEHTFYEWTTSEATAQDYDVYVRWRVPSDFDDSSGFQSNMTLTMYGWRTDATNNSLLVNMFNDAGAVCGTADQVVASGTAAWSSLSFAGMGADADCDNTKINAGDYVWLRFRMNADTGDTIRLGEIEISYKSIY